MFRYWVGYSEDVLAETEYQILSKLKTPYNAFYVPINLNGVEEKIWTISFNKNSPNTPLVLLHGFAAGSAIWCLNFDSLSLNRPVYAMDIIGFARSSRPNFTSDWRENIKKIVDSVEEWRKYLNLEKFHLLGHSMGGYLSTSYAISHPENVRLLILCDPWGFSDKYENPTFILKVLSFLFDITNFNPIGVLRSLGRFGAAYLRLTREDVIKHYRTFLKDDSLIPTYIYQSNANPNPTGEVAFFSLTAGVGWAKYPMIKIIEGLSSNIPIKMIYGADTWMDKDIGFRVKEMRPKSSVDVQYVENSEHHVYLDQAEIFNKSVNEACSCIERNNCFL